MKTVVFEAQFRPPILIDKQSTVGFLSEDHGTLKPRFLDSSSDSKNILTCCIYNLNLIRQYIIVINGKPMQPSGKKFLKDKKALDFIKNLSPIQTNS